jgi:hypothetical protein
MNKAKKTYGAMYCIGIVLMVASVMGHLINYAINGVHGFKTFIISVQLSVARDQLLVPSDQIKYYVARVPKSWREISSVAYYVTYVTIFVYLLGAVCFFIAKKRRNKISRLLD